MAKERLSQVQKVILLAADEYRREFNTDSVVYSRMVKKIALKCDLIHERARTMEPAFLVSVSRSIRNLEKKGMLTLTFRRSRRWGGNSCVIRLFSLTKEGKHRMAEVSHSMVWEDIPWVRRNLEKGKERRRVIAEFEQFLKKTGIRMRGFNP